VGLLQPSPAATTRAMGGLRVFRPFPHHHCTIARAGKRWACLPPRTPRHALLATCARCCALNGKRMRANAVLARLDVSFNLLADGAP
jgi:hypothetical protein